MGELRGGQDKRKGGGGAERNAHCALVVAKLGFASKRGESFKERVVLSVHDRSLQSLR